MSRSVNQRDVSQSGDWRNTAYAADLIFDDDMYDVIPTNGWWKSSLADKKVLLTEVTITQATEPS